MKAPAETPPLSICRNLAKSLFPSETHFCEQLLFARRRNRRLILFCPSETLKKEARQRRCITVIFFRQKLFIFFYSHQVLRPSATFLLAADGIYLTCSINIICGDRPFISFLPSAGGSRHSRDGSAQRRLKKPAKKPKKTRRGSVRTVLGFTGPSPPPSLLPITIASLAHLL